MNMDGQSYGIQWIQHNAEDLKSATAGALVIDAQNHHEEDGAFLTQEDDVDGGQYLVDNVGDVATTNNIDQIAAENLIFMASDGQVVTEIIATAGTDENGTMVVSASDGTPIDCAAVMEQAAAAMAAESIGVQQQEEEDNGGCLDYTAEYVDDAPQMVTEEVITDDWVQHQGEERVEIPAEQIIGSSSQILLDIEVPLPTVQDEYTALRPYPCDFCSRRFRKKTSLMNHMTAHQNDRPHLCKLCGSRFFRRSDLINHLKAHAEAPEPQNDDADFNIDFVELEQQQRRQIDDHYYDQDWQIQAETMTLHTAKSSRRIQNASGNSSSASSSTAVTRVGRISRLKPKEENYTIDETLQHNAAGAAVDYVECQELQASSAAVKLTQDNSPAHQQHYPIIDDSKPFVCQQCGLAFAREKALLSHGKNHRNDSPYECNECNEMFWDTGSLQEHQKTHQFEESNSEYEPGDAAEDSQTESESDNLYGEFYCSECGMSFHRQDLLKRHSKSHIKSAAAGEVDSNRDRHSCNTCGETFAEALDLLAHAEIHARYPPFKCVLCGESFFEEHTIKRHLQSQHAHEMTTNSCILCGRECRDRKALIKHAWDHSREKCHSCSKCGKNFHNKARLKRHMASHRDKSVICDVCQEEFPDGRSLSNHRHSHSVNASTGKLFACNECGKTFGSRSSQQIHVRIHTGERPYGCRFCWKAFADGGTLRKHERIHTGEKPYACSVCPRAFNQRVVLREHIRSHHSHLDAKRGTYYCTVCSAELDTSANLIQHLIQHSDMNTAMQRQPITGPRKYKRRRKLKPHEIAHLRQECKQNGSDIDMSDFDMENVDDLLGIGETQTESTTATTTNSKSTTKVKRSKRNRSNPNASTAGGRNDSVNDSVVQDYDVDEQDDEDDDAVAEEAVAKNRSNNVDKLWQTKLIDINTSAETYKSLLSNLENTLQNIDTLVVGSNSGSVNMDASSTAQRTQQVQILKMETKYMTPHSAASQTNATSTLRARKKAEKTAATKQALRPRMIHTEKSRLPQNDSSKRRTKTYITRTETANLDLMPKTSKTSSMVDDYEIISPATQPPKQISSSPMYIKQEHEQQQQHMRQQQQQQEQLIASNSDLYDAQLLLEASTLRKAAFEKYNPSIVNDLEEILRSPVKSDRQRFMSESSTQFLTEQSEEEHHMIKIEPTSPDLREIVTGASSSNSAVELHTTTPSTAERRSTRSTRLVTANRKYLEFETHSKAQEPIATTTKRTSTQASNRSKAVKTQKKDAAAKTTYHAYASINNVAVTAANTAASTTASNVANSFASISAVVSAADAVAANAHNATPTIEQQRKQRYFECEMCSAVFTDRAQLLDHVPIHI